MSDDEGRNAIISLSGTLTGNRNLIVPTRTKIYAIYNGTAGAFTVTVKTSGGSGVVVAQGTRQFVYCDGTNVVLLGATFTVEESDGSPTVANVNKIKVSNGTLTDNGGGVITISTGGGGGGGALDDLSDVIITTPATNDVLVYNGSDWVNDTVPGGGGGGGSDLVPPVFADFSWQNQGGATASQSSNIYVGASKVSGIPFMAPASGSDNLRQLIKSAPTPPYTIVMAFIPFFFQGDFSQMGFCWRDSGSGKIVGAGVARNSGLKWVVDLWTNQTSYSGNYANKLFDFLPGLCWVKAVDNNTNRIISISPDGEDWRQLHSVSRTDQMTPDTVGMYIDVNNAGFTASMAIVHWDES